MLEVGNRSTPFLVTSYMTVTPLAWPRCIRQDSCSFSMAAGGVDAKDTTVTRSVRQAIDGKPDMPIPCFTKSASRSALKIQAATNASASTAATTVEMFIARRTTMLRGGIGADDVSGLWTDPPSMKSTTSAPTEATQNNVLTLSLNLRKTTSPVTKTAMIASR